MASCSGTSSGASSHSLQSAGSEEELQALMNLKKRKRMDSNRESARRSRLRKQMHLDDLTAQASQVKKENGHILAILDLSTEQYLGVEYENSVLRTQLMELTSRLNSLNEILQYMNLNSASGEQQMFMSDNFLNPWSFLCMNQPAMAASSNTMIQQYQRS